jgi:hypothetical protein
MNVILCNFLLSFKNNLTIIGTLCCKTIVYFDCRIGLILNPTCLPPIDYYFNLH